VTVEDDLDIVIQTFLKACTVGNICAYLPFKVELLSPSSDSGINFAPVFKQDLEPFYIILINEEKARIKIH
jgi:hypothetical protein